jgi:predicted GIY-YIG superfamily endonuclease
VRSRADKNFALFIDTRCLGLHFQLQGWSILHRVNTRRPVTLVYSQSFEHMISAVAAERQIKGWSLVKKKELIRGDFAELKILSKS